MSCLDSNIFTIESHMPNATYRLSKEIRSILTKKYKLNQQLVIMCIGTDRSTGDCLGPLVGDKLTKLRLINRAKIIGNLKEPVHAKNIEARTEEIINTYNDPFIIAIDASLGRGDNVGNINLINGFITPGSGVNKNLKPVGDIGITGIVNISGFMEYLILQNTRLSLVMHMSDIITMALYMAVLRYKASEEISS